jgi:hypothetical protein
MSKTQTLQILKIFNDFNAATFQPVTLHTLISLKNFFPFSADKIHFSIFPIGVQCLC